MAAEAQYRQHVERLEAASRARAVQEGDANALPPPHQTLAMQSKRRHSLSTEAEASPKKPCLSMHTSYFEWKENIPTPESDYSHKGASTWGSAVEDLKAFRESRIGKAPAVAEVIVLVGSDDEQSPHPRDNDVQPASESISFDESCDKDEINYLSLDEALSNIQRYSERPLCPEQLDLVELILNGKNVFYTGSAGCGKSTVLKCFRKCLGKMGKRVFVTAPTGRAALEVDGSTTWSYAGWNPNSMKLPMEEIKTAKGPTKKRFRATDVLVIDEISMVENHWFERLNKIMKSARKCDKPFGGVQLVVTGDFCQLPPVKPFEYCMECGKTFAKVEGGDRRCATHGKFLEDDKWAFCSNAWNECNFVHVNLTTIHRQSDHVYKNILERLRFSKGFRTEDRRLLLHHESNTEGAVKLFPRRNDVLRVNEANFRGLTTPILTYISHDYFWWNEQHILLKSKRQRNVDGSLLALEENEHRYSRQTQLRIGMIVVLLTNINIRGGLVNGSQGTVVGFEKHDPSRLPEQKGDHKGLKAQLIGNFVGSGGNKEWPVVRFTSGREETIFPDCSISELGETQPYSLLSRTQIPLMAGWAMTVHKSQGMTLSRVIVDLADSFEAGQDYVALSRATSLDGLKVERLSRHERKANEKVREFLRANFGIE